MSKTHILPLVILLFGILALPMEVIGQVNPPRFFNPSTGELIERPYVNRYQLALRNNRLREQDRSEESREKRLERQAAYAKDACGLGCEGHEGIQVRPVPGTPLAAVVYKIHRDDDVMTLQLRFHNDGTAPERLALDPLLATESFYVQIGEDRHYILIDDEGELEAKDPLDETLRPGEIESWWARFPAPPPGTTTFDLHIPAVTFRDVMLHAD